MELLKIAEAEENGIAYELKNAITVISYF